MLRTQRLSKLIAPTQSAQPQEPTLEEEEGARRYKPGGRNDAFRMKRDEAQPACALASIKTRTARTLCASARQARAKRPTAGDPPHPARRRSEARPAAGGRRALPDV